MTIPSQITIQSDIEIETTVASALIDEFNRREQGFMNLRVGEDITVFPNMYNIVILVDVAGERDAIITQCNGFYDPEEEELASGEFPYVRLTRTIIPPPEHIIEKMIGADPFFLEAPDDQGTSIVDITPDS